MSKSIALVKQLTLPESEYVVIGSGLLDALGLRESRDLDLAVSEGLFEVLSSTGAYELETKDDAPVLIGNTEETRTIEVWKQWHKDLPFEKLIQKTVIVDGVVFAHPAIIIDRKTRRNQLKDSTDIRLLKEYFNYE